MSGPFSTEKGTTSGFNYQFTSAGHSSQYITSHPVQLGLVIP